MSQLPPPQTWFFLRGLVRESGHWDGFLDLFRAAFPERRAVTLDLPGAGPFFRERSPASIPAIAEAVRAQFLAQRGEENYLFAISLGAMTGLQWMHAHPEDLRGAVLLNTSLRGLSPIHHRLQPGTYASILRIAFSGNAEASERLILAMTSTSEDKFDRLAREWAEIRAKRPVSIGNSLRQLIAAARFRPPMEKPRPRVLLLNSLGDQLAHPSCSERIAAHWKVPLRTHPTAGHDLTLDAGDWVIERVREFS